MALTPPAVNGRYRLLGRIGTGATWLAVDELLRRRVAIREVTGDTAHLRALSALDHPGLIAIYDLVRADDRAYVVTEHVPAGSLADAGPLAHPRAARIGLDVLDALDAAGAAGVRHGNLRPGNVLLSDDGRTILTDFGGTAPDLPALAEVLRTAVRNSPGPLTPAITALAAGAPPARVRALLRAAASGRVTGVVNRQPAAERAPQVNPTQGQQPADERARFADPTRGGRAPASRPGTTEPPAPSTRRLARSTRVTVVAATALLVATTGTALAVDALTPAPDAPAARTPVTEICDERMTVGDTVRPDDADRPYDLPTGWLWHRDPTGFVVAVPQGWTRASDGTSACFRDPAGDRSVQIEPDAPVGAVSWAHWATAERAALAGGALPGYDRIGMRDLPAERGGAEWEFTWADRDGIRRHERRLVLATGGDRATVVRWSTREQDWPGSAPLLDLIVVSLT